MQRPTVRPTSTLAMSTTWKKEGAVVVGAFAIKGQESVIDGLVASAMLAKAIVEAPTPLPSMSASAKAVASGQGSAGAKQKACSASGSSSGSSASYVLFRRQQRPQRARSAQVKADGCVGDESH